MRIQKKGGTRCNFSVFSSIDCAERAVVLLNRYCSIATQSGAGHFCPRGNFRSVLVYMTAAQNKFLRIYYARVKECLEAFDAEAATQT